MSERKPGRLDTSFQKKRLPPGAKQQPISPGFGLTDTNSHGGDLGTVIGPPGGFNGKGPAGPNDRISGRSRVTTPPDQQNIYSTREPKETIKHPGQGGIQPALQQSSASGMSVDAQGFTQFPGTSPWEAPTSIYRNARPVQPPNYIRDVDIDYNWFTPFQPVWPFGPPYVTYPREWDYPVGINLEYIPKRLELYGMLRTMSQSSGVVRAIIETRKDQLLRLPWEIRYKGNDPRNKKPDKKLTDIRNFFKRPDRKNDWDTWLRLILEDLFVIDAATVYIWKAQNGQPYALEVIDGATIKPLVDDAGRIPDYPNPAFQQVIKGLPMVNFDETEMLYLPMRKRPYLPIFGYSPVEQCYMEVTTAIRRILYQMNFWTEGTLPDLIMAVPESWTPNQIAMFQAHFDAMMEGNYRLKSKTRFVPGGMEPFSVKGSAGEMLKSDIDEWMTRIICYAFGVSPSPFVRDMNRATAETAKETAQEEGLFPTMKWVETSLMERILVDGFGADDMEFAWLPNGRVGIGEKAAADVGYVTNGILSINEVRETMGYEPKTGGDNLILIGGQGALPITVQDNDDDDQNNDSQEQKSPKQKSPKQKDVGIVPLTENDDGTQTEVKPKKSPKLKEKETKKLGFVEEELIYSIVAKAIQDVLSDGDRSGGASRPIRRGDQNRSSPLTKTLREIRDSKNWKNY